MPSTSIWISTCSTELSRPPRRDRARAGSHPPRSAPPPACAALTPRCASWIWSRSIPPKILPKPLSSLPACACFRLPRACSAVSLISPLLLQVPVEPRDGAPDNIPAVFRLRNTVALIRIDHELVVHSQRIQCVPEFIRLRQRALAVALSHQNQRWRFHVLDIR